MCSFSPKPFRLLAVDPGSEYSGYAILDQWGDLVEFNTIHIRPNSKDRKYAQDRLGPMFQALDAVVKTWDITHIAYESPAKGGNINPIIALSQVSALMELLAYLNGTRAIEVPPSQGKKALVGKGNATAEEMIATMRTLLGDSLLSPQVDEHNAHALGVGRHAQRAIMANNWQVPPRAAQTKGRSKDPNKPKKPKISKKSAAEVKKARAALYDETADFTPIQRQFLLDIIEEREAERWRGVS